MDNGLALPVWVLVLHRQPEVLAEMVDAGYLSPASLLPAYDTIPPAGDVGEMQGLMAHDAYRRVRGVIRQVRWAG